MTLGMPDWASEIPSAPGIHQEQQNQLTRAFTPQQLVEIGLELIEQFLKRVVLALVGHFIPGRSAFDQLKDYAESIGSTVLHLIAEFLKTAPIAAKNIIGSIIRALVPVGAITGDTPNQLSAPTFDAESISDNADWSIDPGKTHSADGSGSAKTTAAGVVRALRSGSDVTDVTPVSAGQTISASVFVSHQGWTGTGVAALLQVVPFTGSVAGEPFTIGSYSPVAADSDWVEVSDQVEATGVPSSDPTNPALTPTPYTVPDGVDGLQLRIVVTENALSGDFWFDDAKMVQSGGIQRGWLPWLSDELDGIRSLVQLVIDTVVNAITGGATVLNTVEDLFIAFANLPARVISGVLGPGSIGETIEEVVNHIVGGIVGELGSGASLADLFNLMKKVSSGSALAEIAWEILGIRTNKPLDGGLGVSEKSNFPMSSITGWLDSTQSASLIGWDLIEQDMPIGVISWIGYGVDGITEVYVNVWKMDLATGNANIVHTSENVVGIIAGAGEADPGAFISYELPEAIPAKASEVYGYEPVFVGGTHHIQGRAYTLPLHPTSPIRKHASTRNNTTSPSSPPSTILKSEIVWADNAPWISIAVDTGTGGDHHDPVDLYITGPRTFPIPDWCNFVDVVVLGAGGGAQQGLTAGFYGAPGEPGKFNATTWVRDTDFSGSSTVITVAPGAGGIGGAGGGDNGGSTTASIPGKSVSAEGGKGGVGLKFGGHPVGRGPGTFTYGDLTCVGGADQNAYGSDGASPGGAGNGGNWLAFQAGGDGAAGAVWILFRPDPLADSEVPPDMSPPSIPTLSFVSATFSSITVQASGSVDE